MSAIEDRLGQFVEQENTPYHSLFEAARYVLMSGGKRLRPVLTLLVAKMLGAPLEKGLVPACAVEMIHTYSMIHDDLPCMDDDDMRRGKPTLHKVFNEGHAVLTGDFLLTLAFQVIAEEEALDFQKRIEMIQILSKASAAHGLIGGQVVDLLEGSKSLDDLRKLHQNKTGALFGAAAELGAIAGKANEHERRLLRSFGETLGLAYQVLNDILDVSSSAALRGTEVSSDLKNGKVTYVTLLGLNEAQKEFERLMGSCREILGELPRDCQQLEHYLNHIR